MSTKKKSQSLESLANETEETLVNNKKKNKNKSNTETVRNDTSKLHQTSILSTLAPSGAPSGDTDFQPLVNVYIDKAVINEKEVEEVALVKPSGE